MAVTPIEAPAVLDRTSSRPIGEFTSCFAERMTRSGGAWAFSPSPHGGTFTDSGAHNAAATYWLQVRDAGAASRVRLFTSAGPSAAADPVDAVQQCR